MSRLISAVVAAICALLICAGPALAGPEELAEIPAAQHDDLPVIAAGLGSSAMRGGIQLLAMTVVPIHQFWAFDAIITRESAWNVFAVNPTSGAYGLGQALPPEKMSTHGFDWAFNPYTQIRWTYDYMNARYGGPERAWEFWQRHHWY